MTKSKKPISRRRMLTVTGLTVGGGLLAIHSGKGQADDSQTDVKEASSNKTNADKANTDKPTAAEPKSLLSGEEQMVHYAPISSKEAASRAYEAFAEGSCMYAVVKGVVSLVAEKKRSAISPMFYNLFKYGHGGCGGWGSLCGTCNGAAAVMGLFCEEKKTCDKMIAELFRWYESAVLPEYAPASSTDKNFPTSVSESILCHASTSQWARVAKVSVFSPARKERCKRLAADVAKKTVEILNAQHAADKESMEGKKVGKASDSTADRAFGPMGPPDSCIACHSTPGGRPGSYAAEAPKTVTKMNCSKCHYMPPGHPESMGR